MARKITSHEATIHTATVEVRTLTISGRQVTLSVFRQLQNEPLLHEPTLDFVGTPWGKVNYFFGDCSKLEGTGHLHIVWETDGADEDEGGELRRACILPPAHPELFPLTSISSRQLSKALQLTEDCAFLFCALEKPEAISFKMNPRFRGLCGEYSLEGFSFTYFGGEPANHRLVADAVALSSGGGNTWRNPETQEFLVGPAAHSALRLAIRLHLHSLVNDPGRLNLSNVLTHRLKIVGELQAVQSRLSTMRSVYPKVYAKLATLPQLFIAV